MKKRIITLTIAISFVFVFTHCQPNREGSHARIVEVNGHEIINCNISEATDTVDFPLSKIIDRCEIIPLETNDNSLFESIYHVGISDKYIAVHSRGQHPIKLFDRQGKFIRNIGKIGRGPGEFSSLYGIQLDEPANRLYLTPFANAQQIIVYNLEGEAYDPIPLVYKQTKCKVYVEGDLVTILSMPFSNEIPVAYQQTISGELIQKLPVADHLILNPDFSSEVSSSHNAGAYDLFILPWGTESLDTLYYYNAKQNELIPKYVASFTDKKHSSWTYELKDHYYSWVFGDTYNGSKVIVDKKSLKSDFFRLKNDFYGNIEMKQFFMSSNGWFIASMSAMELKQELENVLTSGDLKNQKKTEMEAIQNNLKTDDNDVLFFGKM